jgi:hypothetical protein
VGAVLDAADEQYPVVFEDPERDAVVAASLTARSATVWREAVGSVGKVAVMNSAMAAATSCGGRVP